MAAVNTKILTQCAAVFLGTVGYAKAWDLQRELHGKVAQGLLSNVLLLLEHPHVYTLGRRGKDSDILASRQELEDLGVETHFVDRGGEATYHGPGQLVGYPIVNLRAWDGGPLKYVRTLESALVAALAAFGIRGDTDGRPTGVWAGDGKIAAIGVRVSRGVTMHGFALNVCPDLSYFDRIVPCGDAEGRSTSMSALLGSDVAVEHVVPVVERCFGAALGFDLRRATLEELG